MWWRKKKQKIRLERNFAKNKAEIIAEVDAGLDAIKSALDVPPDLYDQFWLAKETPEYQQAFTDSEPLVTICTATYNRPQVLLERTIPSVLGQSYTNIEYIVVGDGCDEAAYSALKEIKDPRFRFVNLTERGQYPLNPELRWMVAGAAPMNKALELASGRFITHVDDDDAYDPARIEKLVRFAQERKLDFVWHPFYCGSGDGEWERHPAGQFQRGLITNSGVFYHSWLNILPFDVTSYQLREPGDWNRFRKLKHLGIKAERYPEPLLYKYHEGSQSV